MSDDDFSERQTKKYLLAWIVSLATSIVCCSALFFIYANSYADVKGDIAVNKARIDALEERIESMNVELSSYRRRTIAAQQVPGLEVPPPPPVSSTPVEDIKLPAIPQPVPSEPGKKE